ncbi:MAG TPA: hypothetical protein VMB85_01090 [Bryobacteraceae bacterium]|nr:hypothetical protein [Bryobacteraceae bacterium]
MFHWICPECGREIPPSVKECPACDPKARQALAVLETFPGAHAESAVDPLLTLAEHIRSAQAAPARQPERAPEPEPVLTAVAVAEPPPVFAAPEQPRISPQISITTFFPVTRAIALLAPPEVPALAPAPLAAATAVPPLTPVAAPALEPEPQPVEHRTPPPMRQLAASDPLVGERLPSGSWLKLAPLQDYIEAAGQSMRPAPPPRAILMPDSGPRITLPGPALPPNLESLKNAGVVGVARRVDHSRSRVRGWLLSAALMLGIPVVGGALLLYFQPLDRPAAEAKASAAPNTPPVAAPSPAPTPVHSLTDLVEVTGFRFLVDYNKKSEIHYLVVNHSSAQLSDMTVYVTLHTADARAGQPPLCRFSFRAPGLGPFESKEMTSPIEKMSRSVVLPDWQDLRADVQLGQ